MFSIYLKLENQKCKKGIFKKCKKEQNLLVDKFKKGM